MRIARALVFAVVCAFPASCAVGSGTGSVKGSISVPGCGSDLSNYDMQADFFGANAYRNELIISIQHGGGTSEYGDTLTITVQDMDSIERTIEASGGAGATIGLACADGTLTCFERPPGTPVSVQPPPVQMALNLRHSCGAPYLNPLGDQTQIVLEAISGTVTFTSILHGDIQSRDTNSKRIQGSFTVHVEDPRGWGGVSSDPSLTPPSGCTSVVCGDITGDFNFFYQRGGPAQPFP